MKPFIISLNPDPILDPSQNPTLERIPVEKLLWDLQIPIWIRIRSGSGRTLKVGSGLGFEKVMFRICYTDKYDNERIVPSIIWFKKPHPEWSNDGSRDSTKSFRSKRIRIASTKLHRTQFDFWLYYRAFEVWNLMGRLKGRAAPSFTHQATRRQLKKRLNKRNKKVLQCFPYVIRLIIRILFRTVSQEWRE